MIYSSGVVFGYEREYGQHDFTLEGGDEVSVISHPTWEAYWQQLQNASFLGRVVLSPELITSPRPEDGDVDPRELIETRIAQVRDFSRGHPDSTFALGTATFQHTAGSDRPANSLVFISRGGQVAQTNKTLSMYPAEQQVFTLRQERRVPLSVLGMSAMICSDLITETSRLELLEPWLTHSDNPAPASKIDMNSTTALLSACWATALDSALNVDPEQRFRIQLEARIINLFRQRPALRDLVIADRVAPGVDVKPFNGIFSRR